MIIGIVLPEGQSSAIAHYVREKFPQISFDIISYTLISELPSIIEVRQNKVDALLFLGETAIQYVSQYIHPIIPWETIRHTTASLLRILVQAARQNLDMSAVTDLNRPHLFTQAFKETAFQPHEALVYSVPRCPYSDEFLLTDTENLKALYKSKHAGFVVTVFYRVYQLLQEKKIPCFMLSPTFEDIYNAVQKLVLSYQLQISQHNQLIIMSIQVDITDEYLTKQNSYHILLEQIQITRYIHEFASQLHGSCIDISPYTYILLADYTEVEQKTEHFEIINLLKQVQQGSTLTLSIGIGYGQSIDSSMSNAKRAMLRAYKSGGNKAIVIGNKEGLVKPILYNAKEISDMSGKTFSDISLKTGVSVRILSRLYYICCEQCRNRFTSAELAAAIGVTPRTMNRIILKLIDCGLCTETGKFFTHEKGRPHRIIELHIKK